MCHLINVDLKGLDDFWMKQWIWPTGVMNTEVWCFHDNYHVISKISSSSSNTNINDVCFRFRMKNDSRKLKIFFRNFKLQREPAACLLPMISSHTSTHSTTQHSSYILYYSIIYVWQLNRCLTITETSSYMQIATELMQCWINCIGLVMLFICDQNFAILQMKLLAFLSLLLKWKTLNFAILNSIKKLLQILYT